MSLPHFLYADTGYSSKIKGLSPNPSEHSFYIDFEPVSTITFYLLLQSTS